MKKFLVLYHSEATGQERMSSASPAQMQASMEAWMAWKEKHGDFLLDFGSPLGDAQLITTDHATPADNKITGYSLIQAESMETAMQNLKDHPFLSAPGGVSIEVHEYLPMPA